MEGIFALIIMGCLMKMLGQSAKRKKKTAFSTANRLMTKPLSPSPKAAEQPPIPGEGESYSALDPDDDPFQRPEYMGSLAVDSDEGEDACDPTLAHERSERIDPQSVYANEIGAEPPLDFSPRGLYQGVVMSEILTRPAQRARRMR